MRRDVVIVPGRAVAASVERSADWIGLVASRLRVDPARVVQVEVEAAGKWRDRSRIVVVWIVDPSVG